MPVVQEQGRVSCHLNASQTLARKTPLLSDSAKSQYTGGIWLFLLCPRLCGLCSSSSNTQQLPGHNWRPGAAVTAAVRDLER